LVTGVLSFGLDYALLRETFSLQGYAYGTITIFEILVLVAISPFVFLVGTLVYGESFAPYMTLAIAAFLVFGLAFTSKFAAIGLLKTRIVLLYDTIGAIIRFSTGILLVTLGFGGLGIVMAGIFQQAVVALGLALICYRKIGFKWGGTEKLKNLLKIGLSNFPTKISLLISMNLSVALLASAADPSSVGVFYIALMISLVTGGLATSIATMAIPASANNNNDRQDSTATTLRLGLCLTTPLVAALASSSEFILSLVGEGYRTGSTSLVILAIALPPTIIVSNVVSKLNRERKFRQLVQLGLIQLLVFLLVFSFPSDLPKTFCTSLAILTSSTAASVAAFKWLSFKAARLIVLSATSISVGWLIGTFVGSFSSVAGLLLALASSFMVILLMKGVTSSEISDLLRMIKEQ
jgi:O-antigen/teichoic acid export membrane protein